MGSGRIRVDGETREDTNVGAFSWVSRTAMVRLYDRDAGQHVVFHRWEPMRDVPPQDRDVLHQAVRGDRLDLLAYRYYGDPTLWWVIAARNELDLAIAGVYPGRTLLIPDPDWVRTQAGRV